jgi:putative YphP/YqiW family bacilliredoxin
MAYHSKKRLFLLPKAEKFTVRYDFLALLHSLDCQIRMLSQLGRRESTFCVDLRSIIELKNNTIYMYPAEIVQPMKEELTDYGFTELLTPTDVNNTLKEQGTTLVMINSVCGCSAGSARPGVLMAVANASKKPDHLSTSFAGFDVDAIRTLREHLLPYPPSSPAIALFKNGQLVHFIERHQIEGRPAQMIAHNLIAAFDEYC